MNHELITALWDFSTLYVQSWQQAHNSLPIAEGYENLPSPCCVFKGALSSEQKDHSYEAKVRWQPIKREQFADFSNVEQGIGLTLHSDIKTFYASQFAADMPVLFQGEHLVLIQVWSDEDLTRLQENILGHLVMQKRLKNEPSVFIASTKDERELISICNTSGKVIKEKIGTNERVVIAKQMVDFINVLIPDV